MPERAFTDAGRLEKTMPFVADQALYDAKHAGRNCIVPFQPTSQAS